jgi:hypothetical protein
MQRLGQIGAAAALLAVTALHAGCGNNASGLTTGDLGPSDAPAGISNEDPLARPVQVAWTSARARRCGFYFDADKLRGAYFAYEAKQGAAGEQMAKLQRTYETTFKSIYEKVGSDPGYCTDRKGAEIKADLQRHLAGDFAPNLPKPKPMASCGFFGCTGASTTQDEPFDSKKFWTERDKNPRR